MAESVEEIINKSLHDTVPLNESWQLNQLIAQENDSLNVLKNMKNHLEGQGILQMLFKIQKEIYTQTWEKMIQDYMANEFSNKITTLDELKMGLESFVHSFHNSFAKLNSSIISVIAK